MKLVFFSDTHNQHDKVPLESGDILFHCGDFTRKGSLDDVKSFARFVGMQDFKYKVVIAGNHDFSFEDDRKIEAENILKEHGIIYLNDSLVELDSLKIWGSPITPMYHNWAFMRERGEEIQKHWELIPNDVDIILTHGPPANIMDLCYNGERDGCHILLEKILEIKPKIHAFGHIHEEYGVLEQDGIKFINACSLDEKYIYQNKPIIVEI